MPRREQEQWAGVSSSKKGKHEKGRENYTRLEQRPIPIVDYDHDGLPLPNEKIENLNLISELLCVPLR